MAEKVELKENKVKTAKSIARFIKISPRKARLVADAIRGQHVAEAIILLQNMNKRAAGIILKTLLSAVANAENQSLDKELLILSEIKVDGGPVTRRWKPRARGRASGIRRPTSHLTITLEETIESKKQKRIALPSIIKRPVKTKETADEESEKVEKTAANIAANRKQQDDKVKPAKKEGLKGKIFQRKKGDK